MGSGQSMVSVVGDRNPRNQDSHLGSEVRLKQAPRDLPTYPQELSEPMAKRAFDPTQAVAELAARKGPQKVHIDRTSNSGRCSAVLQKKASMGLVAVGQ